ncbi:MULTISPECIES: FAD-dependent oxidoreductase [Streptomyces]|uniref:D-amino-acid oxidase n=1 Tax=Streptomyces cavourensis TaxID=67258 RepID=A0AAD0Q9U1_9ACTN|nr:MULTISPECIES: FAD-dependent oxidoreductase [Streptomyces]ATY99240.1 amino acid oxidase [Streptomyces cavourensis]AXI75073.1 FAD-binding oxidoreductase [Streptomyces cavourensis]NUV79953.1 FAD-binding oxidoreductase [Streptomyces sp. CAI-155]UTR79444.1 FAD-binding oxidoreductase [Streptomyces cavourensis]
MAAEADVIVVGGGVIGLTTAVTLAERGLRVRVWSRDPAGATTSAVAGALWWPYRIEPAERVGIWSLETLAVYEELAAAPEETGVRLVPGLHGGERFSALGPWAAELKDAVEVAEGLRVVLPLLDMPVHLAWLERRLVAAGGAVERRAVTGFAEAAERSPVVVNCTGLGARELVPDPGMRAVRGQLVLVENPGIEEWFTEADPASEATTYFFPQPGRLVLGGTARADDERPEPDAAVAREIVARCARVRPEIADARVLGHRVGLRPVREGGVRIEVGALPGGGLLVHNYGHGGAGVTVAWGCARAAAALVG